MKYEIEISEGCTSFGTFINGRAMFGEDVHSCLTEEERGEFLDYLLAEFKRQYYQSSVSIEDLIRCFQYDHYEYNKNSCDQCGDSTSSTIWKL